MATVIAVGKVNIAGLMDGAVFQPCDIICTDRVSRVAARGAVLAAGQGAKLPKRLDCMAVIVDADEPFNPELLQGNAVITCGVGARNTVSITSRTTERITLSLNRAIATAVGVCEPLELPVPLFEGYSAFDYMAAFAVAVLTSGGEVG